MIIDRMENEISDFIDEYFEKNFDLIEYNFEFMQKYSLYEPKVNYLFTLKFLNTLMKYFSSLDYKFSSSTLKKIYKDINSLNKLYIKQQDDLKNIKKVFYTFSKDNRVLVDMKDYSSKYYNNMKNVYFIYFRDDFIQQHKYIIKSLEIIMNSKIYYFEKLLWRDAIESEIVYKKLQALKLEGRINSYSYLVERLRVSLPYTDDYQYLQKCMRIYEC